MNKTSYKYVNLFKNKYLKHLHGFRDLVKASDLDE
jgi:hypothetical protein